MQAFMSAKYVLLDYIYLDNFDLKIEAVFLIVSDNNNNDRQDQISLYQSIFSQ